MRAVILPPVGALALAVLLVPAPALLADLLLVLPVVFAGVCQQPLLVLAVVLAPVSQNALAVGGVVGPPCRCRIVLRCHLALLPYMPQRPRFPARRLSWPRCATGSARGSHLGSGFASPAPSVPPAWPALTAVEMTGRIIR